MFGEIAEQAIHLGKIGAVDQVSALLLGAYQAGMRELLQMKGQRIPCNTELICQHTGGEAGKAGDDQRAERAQPLGMGKTAECGDSLIFIHKSIIQRLLNNCLTSARIRPDQKPRRRLWGRPLAKCWCAGPKPQASKRSQPRHARETLLSAWPRRPGIGG